MPLYAFGSNGSGQLAIGHIEDVSTPTKCLFEDTSPPPASEITRIAAGGNHTLVLFSDGRVYATGMNVDGRCGAVPGNGDNDGTVMRFRRVVVDGVQRFRDVSATWEASFLVAGEGGGEGRRVFVFGSGGKGELGLGGGVVRVSVPSGGGDRGSIGFGEKVVGIASGMGHTVVVLENGEVYGWGAARKGQLGQAVKGDKVVWEPVRIGEVGFQATGAACGREFTVVVGDREKGEFVVLGSAEDRWGVLAGSLIPVPVGCRSIEASWHGVYVHCQDGDVVAWGRNDRGQLPPREMGRVRDLAVGSEHVLATVDERTVVACGWGEHGNCGPVTDTQGNVKGTCSPIPLPEEVSSVVGISAGCATSWVITRD
ncbi:alpha-tubulin suppressor protein Aats1 [Aspergillus sclerotiicarbonarius CBS 121057]|uniref:Alpha-tubulin suppressor protein Aats1 n=1 Tax=Aspergillus sclerotiicarbonarius (strain CBS 121057 / IBT 28362) TaxID=1448318 RepID=A0A319FM83_ASPSB|nr:alpha-tubulin suppressor protein Aats1 [Aspergillus sclerotiicarbonarius CBS 121057]